MEKTDLIFNSLKVIVQEQENGDCFVLLHCFIKKTNKTPHSEIEKAKKEFEDFKRRSVNG